MTSKLKHYRLITHGRGVEHRTREPNVARGKDFVPQCECLVSEVGLRKLRENGCEVMTDNFQKLRLE